VVGAADSRGGGTRQVALQLPTYTSDDTTQSRSIRSRRNPTQVDFECGRAGDRSVRTATVRLLNSQRRGIGQLGEPVVCFRAPGRGEGWSASQGTPEEPGVADVDPTSSSVPIDRTGPARGKPCGQPVMGVASSQDVLQRGIG